MEWSRGAGLSRMAWSGGLDTLAWFYVAECCDFVSFVERESVGAYGHSWIEKESRSRRSKLNVLRKEVHDFYEDLNCARPASRSLRRRLRGSIFRVRRGNAARGGG